MNALTLHIPIENDISLVPKWNWGMPSAATPRFVEAEQA